MDRRSCGREKTIVRPQYHGSPRAAQNSIEPEHLAAKRARAAHAWKAQAQHASPPPYVDHLNKANGTRGAPPAGFRPWATLGAASTTTRSLPVRRRVA